MLSAGSMKQDRCAGECLMFSDNAQPHPSNSDMFEPRLRLGMLGELWQDWFETLSQVAYQTHRACEFLAQNGAVSNGRFGPFDFRSLRHPSAAPNGSIDTDKLRQCLQSMDPAQAAQVVHAVQMMQAMEAMLAARRSRANEAEGPAW
jgi:hypothetical protein